MDRRQTNRAAFGTALGVCAVRWNAAGITAVVLPHPDPAAQPRIDESAHLPPFVRTAIDGIRATMAGEATDLRAIPLDLGGIDAWRRAVYAATQEIAPGRTRSYGELAKAIGRDDHQGARDVGAALARNPFPVIVPCHRVVAASGALHGFSGPGGLETKRRMLDLEGAPGHGQQRLFG